MREYKTDRQLLCGVARTRNQYLAVALRGAAGPIGVEDGAENLTGMGAQGQPAVFRCHAADRAEGVGLCGRTPRPSPRSNRQRL